jgi:CTP:molybdopterin cytidylyltransferase MocA
VRTVAVIVANDPGEGFTASKYLEPLRGVPMIESIVHDAAMWPVDEIVVVLGGDAEEIVAGADLADATIIIDPDWAEGMASSLRVAIDLLLRGPGVDRVVVGLADQPGVEAETVAALLAGSAGAVAVIPKYRYRRGWPIVIASPLFDLLLGLEGDPDIHDIVESHTAGAAEVWVDRLEPARVRTPDDLPPARPGSGDARARGDG